MASAFKSKAQMERCRQLVTDGKMTQEAFDESLKLTEKPEQLPERLHPKREKKEGSEPGSES